MSNAAMDGGNGGGGPKKFHRSRVKSVGAIGLLTILAQYGVGVKNESTQKAVLEDIAKQQILQLRVEQAQVYVQREEIRDVIKNIDDRLAHIEERIEKINARVSNMDGYLRRKTVINFGDEEYGQNASRK